MDAAEVPLPPQEAKRSPLGSVSELSEYIRTSRQPLDYGRLITPQTRVLAIGEQHPEKNPKQELKNNLFRLKELGFTHLALEFWGGDMQPVLDEFQATGHFTGSKITPEYMDILTAARGLRIKIIANDLTQEERKEYNGLDNEQSTERDRKMAARVKKILDENGNNKVVTYTGAVHAAKRDYVLAGMLTEAGFDVATIALYGEKSISDPFQNYGPIYEAIEQTSTERDRFMLPALSKFPDSSYPYDWIAHVPLETTFMHEESYKTDIPQKKELVKKI